MLLKVDLCTFSQIFSFNGHFGFHITLLKPYKTHYFGSNTLFASLGSDPDTSRSHFPSSSAQIYVLVLAKTIFGSQSHPSFYIFVVTFSQQILQFCLLQSFQTLRTLLTPYRNELCIVLCVFNAYHLLVLKNCHLCKKQIFIVLNHNLIQKLHRFISFLSTIECDEMFIYTVTFLRYCHNCGHV